MYMSGKRYLAKLKNGSSTKWLTRRCTGQAGERDVEAEEKLGGSIYSPSSPTDR